MKVSGRSPDGKFVEIAELPSHPWFVAVQFHPEFQSRPLRPHPLFASFVEAAHRHKTGHAGRRSRLRRSEFQVRWSRAQSAERDVLATRFVAAGRPRPRRQGVVDGQDPTRMATVNPVQVGSFSVGGGHPLAFILGPVRHREPATTRSRRRPQIKEIAARCAVPVIFKASYDKANRTSRTSFRGPGLEAGLATLGEIRSAHAGCRS